MTLLFTTTSHFFFFFFATLRPIHTCGYFSHTARNSRPVWELQLFHCEIAHTNRMALEQETSKHLHQKRSTTPRFDSGVWCLRTIPTELFDSSLPARCHRAAQKPAEPKHEFAGQFPLQKLPRIYVQWIPTGPPNPPVLIWTIAIRENEAKNWWNGKQLACKTQCLEMITIILFCPTQDPRSQNNFNERKWSPILAERTIF